MMHYSVCLYVIEMKKLAQYVRTYYQVSILLISMGLKPCKCECLYNPALKSGVNKGNILRDFSPETLAIYVKSITLNK